MQPRSLLLKASLCVGFVLPLLVSFGSFATAQQCLELPSGMTGWWPGADDITISANHGTLKNGATFAPGLVSQAFSLDGILAGRGALSSAKSQDLIAVPNSSNPGNAWCIDVLRAQDPTWTWTDYPTLRVNQMAVLVGSTRAGESPQEGKSDNTVEVLIVNVDPTDPGVPLDLTLIVRLFPKERLLEITARVGKHPAFPAEIFFDKDVKVQIQLPPELQLHAGSLTWQGDLQGKESAQFQATVKAVGDLEGAVEALAIGHAAVGGRVDADSERFYVLVRGETIQIGLSPLTPFELSQPGTAKPRK